MGQEWRGANERRPTPLFQRLIPRTPLDEAGSFYSQDPHRLRSRREFAGEAEGRITSFCVCTFSVTGPTRSRSFVGECCMS